MSSRLQKSVEDMAAFCAALRYVPVPGGAEGWYGPVTPIQSTERLLDLLDDIHHNRPIYTVAGGELRHLPACRERHCSHPWMERIRPEDLVRTFETRLYYSGGHDDPRCWITGIDLTNGRHMWSDGSICPFLSSKASWDWTVDTVADFVGHVSVWLTSWMIFQQTGTWIVGEHGNTGGYHLGAIKPNERCWCRSGKKYRKCHMPQDQILAQRGR